MVKRVRIGGSTAEKSEMPGFIKPQFAFLKAKGEIHRIRPSLWRSCTLQRSRG